MVTRMSSRREVLKFGAAAAAVGVAVTAAPSTSTAAPSSAGAALAPVDAPPWTLLNPYRSGDAVGSWTLTGLSALDHGAAVIELSDASRTARVHVCALGAAPRGVASTDRFDLLLMNGGDGTTASDEPLARAIAVLAAAIGANTDAALQAHPELAALLTHPERLEAFDSADCNVLA